MKADTSVAVVSVVRRRRMELIRRSSELAVRTRLRTWVFKDRWQSRVTTTFLTVSEKRTDALPMSKESGIERAVDILMEEIIMSSVLSSLSFSLLSFIQYFMSSITKPHRVNEVRKAIRCSRVLELGVVSVLTMDDRMTFNDYSERDSVPNEKNRTHNRSLRNTARYRCWHRYKRMNRD